MPAQEEIQEVNNKNKETTSKEKGNENNKTDTSNKESLYTEFQDFKQKTESKEATQDITSPYTDRETLMLVSYSILVTADSKEILDENCNDLLGTLENQNLAVVRETLNQNPFIFHSFQVEAI